MWCDCDLKGSARRFCCDLKKGSNHKSRDLKVRLEPFSTAICGKFLRFGLRNLKSLVICDLRFGALSLALAHTARHMKLKPPTGPTLIPGRLYVGISLPDYHNLKTTPTPNENGSYSVKAGIRMPS